MGGRCFFRRYESAMKFAHPILSPIKLDLNLGLPIATGVIEGACRHLVKDRMDITGAQWRLSSAEAVMRLRALRSSNDFDAYWEFHEFCEHKRNHQALYQDGEIPSSTRLPQSSSSRGHLRVIK